MESDGDSKCNAPVYDQVQVLSDCAMASILPSLNQLQTLGNATALTVYGDWFIRPKVRSLDFSIDEEDPCKCMCDCRKCERLVGKCITPTERHVSVEIKSNDFWYNLRQNLKPPRKRQQTSQRNDFWSTLKKRMHPAKQVPPKI